MKQNMLSIDFLEKRLGPASPANFLHDFSRKIRMLYSINLPNFTAISS